ncbi:MAG: feruloyl-CoA synthase [Reinekea sp.]|jgi:feruloyl-CoA synthase
MNIRIQDEGIHSHAVTIEHRNDGTMLARPVGELEPYAEKLTDRLEHWAEVQPERIFIAQRDQNGQWQELTYAQTLAQVKIIASYLSKQELSPERPIMVLSGNSTEHLLVGLAAMYIGVPYAPISPAYSLISRDYQKLKHIHALLTPGLIFVDNVNAFAPALASLDLTDCNIMTVTPCQSDLPFAEKIATLQSTLDTPLADNLTALNDAVNADTIAKFLFTSGSTGTPKGVINTQRMICANQVMLSSIFKYVRDEPPVLLDWLPWNHTFGGNHNVGIALYNGGTFYIDAGKPVPQGIHATLENLKDVSPTIYFNVPKGYEILVHHLKQQPDIAKKFFSKLRAFQYAGASMAQHVWDDLYALAEQYTGHRIPILTGLGSTETAPAAMFCSVEEAASGVVGTPIPGVELKLVPNLSKLEVRVRGVSVTPGYWREEERTRDAFDEEGFYCLGDAIKFIDPEAPSRGFLFDGRITEDFKLDTGTWVSVGTLRVAAIEFFAPLMQDLVVTGRDRGFVGGLVFPDVEHCRALIPNGESLTQTEIVAHENVRKAFMEKLQAFKKVATGSSNRICSLILQGTPAKLDASEITDKGSLNQNAVVEHRQQDVLDIYSDTPSENVLTIRNS